MCLSLSQICGVPFMSRDELDVSLFTIFSILRSLSADDRPLNRLIPLAPSHQFLKPLKKYFEKLDQLDEFTALVDLFKPVMHTLLLIWKHSAHYNVAPRFVTLVLEICNDLIMQVGG